MATFLGNGPRSPERVIQLHAPTLQFPFGRTQPGKAFEQAQDRGAPCLGLGPPLRSWV